MGRADYLALGDYNCICYECGRKRKASEMKKHWQGYWVCPEHWEPRQQQDYVRSVPEVITPPWTQPPSDTFLNNCTSESRSAYPGLAAPGCVMPDFISPFIAEDAIPVPPAPDPGYQINHSLILQAAADSYLSKAVVGASADSQKFTISLWLKRSELATQAALVYGFYDVTARFIYFFYDTGHLGIYSLAAGGFGVYANLVSTETIVDTTTHHHIVLGFDTTQAVDTDRISLEIDGVASGFTLGGGGTGKYPVLNSTNVIMANSSTTYIGNSTDWTGVGIDESVAGHYSEIVFIDGQKLSASDFAEDVGGNWVPKEYLGTYGGQGFHLKFDDVGTIGLDSSGNSNTFTLTDGTLPDDWSTDTPTNPA